MSEQEMELEPHRIAARVRAAIAYSGRAHEEVGRLSGLGIGKVRRIASPANPRGASLLELWSIADACGVPRAWLEVGRWDDAELEPAPRPAQTYPFGAGPVEDRLEVIERYLFALLRLEERRGDPRCVPRKLPPALHRAEPSREAAVELWRRRVVVQITPLADRGDAVEHVIRLAGGELELPCPPFHPAVMVRAAARRCACRFSLFAGTAG
jgi:hypothetical protein